jgi:hypothetical protein
MLATAEKPVPTKLQRVNVTFEPELYEALEACSERCKRTLSNQVSIVVEEFLLKTGDLKEPVDRRKHGGKRPNAGRRKASTEESQIEPTADPDGSAK